MFQPVFVCWLVCQEDYTKTTEGISTKLGWKMGVSQEQTPLTSGADPDKGLDSGTIISLPLI